MRHLRLGLAVFALLGACRSEIPSDSTLCWRMGSTPTDPFQSLCEEEMCFQEVQRDTLVGANWMAPQWSSAQMNPSTDAAPREIWLTYASGIGSVGNFIQVKFDNRVATQPSLAKFRQYIIGSAGTYETSQGEMKFTDGDVDVLDYSNGRLKVRIHATFGEIFYAGLDLRGSLDWCAYGPGKPGSDPERGELVLDIDAPIDTTPPSP